MKNGENNSGNNLNVNIPQLLATKYPQWIFQCPQILQLNEDLEPIKTWNNKKEIADYFNKKIQGVDLALRKCVRFQGFYWVIKILYEEEGLRPLLTEKRNTAIYAYNPPEDILQRYYDYEEFTQADFRKEGLKEQFQFIGRFRNSVAAGDFLDLSVTNIRRVAKNELIFHKDYFFSFTPLMPIHKLVADIFELNGKNSRNQLKEDKKVKLYNDIKEFKETYTEEGRVVGNAEKKLYKIINENFKE